MQPNSYYGGGISTQFPTKQKNTRRKLLIASGAVVFAIIIALAALTSGSANKKGSDVSRRVISLISEGKGVDSYALLTPASKNATSQEDWVEFVVANKSKMAAQDTLKLVYVQEVDDSQKEEAYNIGQSGSIYRIQIIVNTDSKLVESVSINKTVL